MITVAGTRLNNGNPKYEGAEPGMIRYKVAATSRTMMD